MLANLLAPGLLQILAVRTKANSPTELLAADEMLHLRVASPEKFEGRIFFLNDWAGGDKDNQNAAIELNRNSKIKEGVTVLSDIPGRVPKKVKVADLVLDAALLAKSSREGKIAIAMGAHSRHALAWLTALPAESYNFKNIILVTHSNWNELDGRAGYDANKKPGDPALADTHGTPLRRGLYANLSRISDLGVTILEIPRTDSGPGGWGDRIGKGDFDAEKTKPYDISDLGLVRYVKTGVVSATREQRNAFVSPEAQKPEEL